MAFQRAQRKRAFLKLAITGPSGGGKTYSALRLAFGLGGKVAMIDTENRSGSLYDELGEYYVEELAPPFTVERYEGLIQDACRGGFDVLIIDSISHAWAAEGGLLSEKEGLDARPGAGERNRFANWAPISKKHEAFKQAILQAPIHIICTMRSKMDYALTDAGKVQRVGLAPVQREGMEYEFTTVFDVASDHSAMASKDRTQLFGGLNVKLTEEHGQKLRGWLENAAAPSAAPDARERIAAGMRENEQPLPVQTNGHAAPAGEEDEKAHWRRRVFAVYTDRRGKQSPEQMRLDLGTILGREVDSRGTMTTAEMRQCAEALEAETPAEAPTPAPSANGDRGCSGPECGKPLTKGQLDISMRAFGKPLCPGCQRQQARVA
jgi:hypothetical protein